MIRELLDDYLDGELPAAQRAQVETRLSAEPSLAMTLSRIQRERALRQAAFASFEPSAAEAANTAARTMAALNQRAPLGYVGIWARWAVGVAAALAIVAGSFEIGRISATVPSTATPTAAKAEPQVIYRVMYFNDTGDRQVREFATVDEANDFMNQSDIKRGEPQVASVDLNHPGSF